MLLQDIILPAIIAQILQDIFGKMLKDMTRSECISRRKRKPKAVAEKSISIIQLNMLLSYILLIIILIKKYI